MLPLRNIEEKNTPYRCRPLAEALNSADQKKIYKIFDNQLRWNQIDHLVNTKLERVTHTVHIDIEIYINFFSSSDYNNRSFCSVRVFTHKLSTWHWIFNDVA